MAMGGSGGAAAPPHGQVYLSEWRRAFDRLVKMLRQTHAQAEALAVERAHLLTELDFHSCGRREREDIFQARIQKISREVARRKRAEKVEAAKRLGKKEMELCCYQKFAELAENDLEDFRSFISTLAAENNELKIKLKEIESQAELSESNVSHQHSAKDLRAELRKLKQAYKTLSSEKDKEISAIRAERNFVWNQHNTMEKEYREICKKKTIEAKQATEAAEKLQQNVDELQVAAQQKDDEINRLRAEVVSAKEKMISLEDELKQMHSMVKGNYVETDKHKYDQPETSEKCKQNINETNRKSKSEGPVSMEKSSNSQATLVKREVKTSRTRVPSAKEIQSQSRGQSDASQKRKRGSSLYGPRPCSTRLQVRTPALPTLFSPCFRVPRLERPQLPSPKPL